MTPKTRPMNLMEALQNPELRELIDSIEDMIVSMRGRGHDPILAEAFENACAELERRTGIDYRN
ncbi:hypothetical protein SAMN05216257_10498 [Meinhardsimonia xiamenensis]|jgi:hypothetical protein|uniref:Uncharacterized protein n=1 Tax=Meinhardsimonia xiamenensis TaxID=990712 RepID=A0A1G9E0C4_9RHOB|nr:hypothetical protein [Meinhardsimonia xiamenensis]PRX29017.1 hypothetical protein LV81_02961 [Meinhardsimonia xiamenensis]SDK69564.1 hypothetical protein SAMN05216257_10498 [Meinhardsimonia xiamenensis]